LSRVHVETGWTPVVYGDVDGDGSDEAALYVDCNNGGGTADGVLAYAQVVFTVGPRGPAVLGVVRPRVQPRNGAATLVQVALRRGRVVAHEAFYAGGESICCPSARATTVWKYAGGKLVPTSTVVTKTATP
jgi:hypothetical protein